MRGVGGVNTCRFHSYFYKNEVDRKSWCYFYEPLFQNLLVVLSRRLVAYGVVLSKVFVANSRNVSIW